jgi:(2Fe-2S) ferredoxin
MRFKHHLFICENLRAEGDPKGSCARKGSPAIKAAMKEEIKKRMISGEIAKGTVRANQAGCLDACEFGPSIVVYPEEIWYGGVTVEDVPEIVESHIIGGKPVERLRILKYSQTAQNNEN